MSLYRRLLCRRPFRGLRKGSGTRFLWCSAHGDYASPGIGVYRGLSVSRCMLAPRRVGPAPPANNHDHLVTTDHESPGARFEYPSPRRKPGSIPRLAGLESGFRRNDEAANPEAGLSGKNSNIFTVNWKRTDLSCAGAPMTHFSSLRRKRMEVFGKRVQGRRQHLGIVTDSRPHQGWSCWVGTSFFHEFHPRLRMATIAWPLRGQNLSSRL